MRLESSLTPWSEPPHPGFFRAPEQFVDAANENRLIAELRGRATIRDPNVVLAHAAAEFLRADRTAAGEARAAMVDRATAFADLAVTGRLTYDRFRNALNLVAVEGNTRQRLAGEAVRPSDDGIRTAMDRALDRAFTVAWALRGTVAQRAALRLQLGWIAVSGEDDKPHRPVNVPAPPYEQYEVVVRTPIGRRLELGVATRYLVASLEEGPVASTGIAPRRAPHDLIPHIPADHEILVFLQQGLAHGRKYAVISYHANFRQWHWRVACEQLIYSHVENEVYGDASTPIRCTLNTVRTLLVALPAKIGETLHAPVITVEGGEVPGP